MRLSRYGVKFETQLFDVLSLPGEKTLRIYSDETKKYYLATPEELSRTIRGRIRLDQIEVEKFGWVFDDWKRIGSENRFGLRLAIFERIKRRKLKDGVLKEASKIWIVDDPRLVVYAKQIRTMDMLAINGSFPVAGMILKKTAERLDVHPSANHIEESATGSKVFGAPEKADTGQAEFAELIELADLSQPMKPTGPMKLTQPKNLKSEAHDSGSHKQHHDIRVDLDTLSVKREKDKASLYKLPASYTRVENLTEVLELGRLDGKLTF